MAWTRKVFDKFKMPQIQPPIASDLPRNGGMTGKMPVIEPPEIPAGLLEKLGQTLAPPPAEPVGAGTGRMMPVIEPAPDAQAAFAPQSLPSITPPVNPMAVAPALPIIEQAPSLKDRVNTIHNKDYSIQKDEFGNVTHRGKDRDKKWSIWDKVGSAALGFATGGIPGAIQAATDRNFFEKMGDQNKLARLYPQIEQARKQEEFDIQTQEARRKAEMDKLNAQGKALDNLRNANKPLYDSVTADGQITPEEAEKLTQAGYPVVSYDARRFDTEQREGSTYERPQLGKPTWQESNLPTERTKVPVGVKVKNPDGSETEIPMLPGDAADFRYKSERDKAEAIARQAEVERRERETQEKREEKAFGSVQEWEAARTKANQIIPTYERSIQQIDRSINEIDQQIKTYQGSYDTSELLKTKQNLEKQRIDAEVKLGEARAVYQTPKPKTFTPPARSNKNPKRNRSYTDSDIDRIIRQ